jgi:hypothetical protein
MWQGLEGDTLKEKSYIVELTTHSHRHELGLASILITGGRKDTRETSQKTVIVNAAAKGEKAV